MTAINEFEKAAADLARYDDEIVDHLPSATAPRLEGWSDQTLAKLRSAYKFPGYAYNQGNLKKILARFYDFYFSGTIREGDNLSATVCDIIAISRTPFDAIWDADTDPAKTLSEKDRQELGAATIFYESNVSDSDKIREDAVGGVATLVYPSSVITQEQKEAYRSLAESYDANSVSIFQREIKTKLSEISLVAGLTASNRNFVCMTSFLALTLFRSATRDKEQMVNAFLKKQYRQNLTTICKWDAASPWTPPIEECIRVCTNGLIKGLPTTRAIFCILANEFVMTQKTHYPDPNVAGFLSASVLTHTAKNGLGLIQMIDQVNIILDTTWKVLRDNTNLDKTIASWKLLCRFYRTYASKGALQYGYHWARVVNDGYLRDYSQKENIFLAVVLAGILEKQQGEGIWSAKWAEGKRAMYHSARVYGNTVFVHMRANIDKIQAAGASKAHLAAAQQAMTAPPELDDPVLLLKQLGL